MAGSRETTSECVTAATSAQAENEAFVDILRSLNHTNHNANDNINNTDTHGDGEHAHDEDDAVNISTKAHLTDPTGLPYTNTPATNTPATSDTPDTSDIDLFLSAYDTTLSPVVAQRVVAATKDRPGLLDSVGFAPENVSLCMYMNVQYIIIMIVKNISL